MYNISIYKISDKDKDQDKSMTVSAYDVPIEDVRKVISILLPDYEEEQEVKDVIVARPKCIYCKFAPLKATDPPCYPCYCTDNRPNFKPNESCKELYSKIKEAEKKSKPKYMTEEAYKEWREEMNE